MRVFGLQSGSVRRPDNNTFIALFPDQDADQKRFTKATKPVETIKRGR